MTHRKRSAIASSELLEPRVLLSDGSLVARWVGQNGHDLVGRSSDPGPSGIQDIQITLEGLSAKLSVESLEVRGFGGGLWSYQSLNNAWAAAFVQEPGTTEAALFIEPYQIEVGREFSVRVWYSDGSTTQVFLDGGTADPDLRMPEATAVASWIGQNGDDRVGPGPSVGPDGIQDAVIALSNLTEEVEVDRILIDGGPIGLSWATGTNQVALANAELVRDPGDPTLGLLYLQSPIDLEGSSLDLTILYVNQTSDQVAVTAESIDPGLQVEAAPELPIRSNMMVAEWLGQGFDEIVGPGAISVGLDGLPANRGVVAATLTGSTRGESWVYHPDDRTVVHTEPGAGQLVLRRNTVNTSLATINFAPERNHEDTNFTLRINFDDGTFSILRFHGELTDLGLRSPTPDLTNHITAAPGDDLQALVDQYDVVELESGIFELDKPLVLNRPVKLTGTSDSTLLFRQQSDSEPWTAAITIHHGQTTLEGFAIRFASTVEWNSTVSFGPAVIASTITGSTESNQSGTKVGISILGLDLQAPPVQITNDIPSLGVKLIQLVSAESGKIIGNTLKGGTVQLRGGPWEVLENHYRGATPGTFAFEVFAILEPHDLQIRDNIASPEPGSGKTYRFAVLTQGGERINVESNRIEGIGPRDADLIPHPNAPEIILTEAYRVRFEGMPLRLTADGTILQIPEPQGATPQAGDILAILTGPLAGEWRRVDHVIDPATLLLDRPLPDDLPIGVVSVSTGFTDLAIAANEINVRGSSESSPIVLAGAHFGSEVSNNTIIGGAPSRFLSTAAEEPVHWGWTHTPVFGLELSSNTFIDSLGGITVGTQRGDEYKTSVGRVYFQGALTSNDFEWRSDYFVETGTQSNPLGVQLGDVRALDPIESILQSSGNRMTLPPGIDPADPIEVHVATLNGRPIVFETVSIDTSFQEPLGPPGGLRLVSDSGIDSADRLTNDPRLRFDPVVGAIGFEYRVVGRDSSYLPLEPGTFEFDPGQLGDGAVNILVRGVDSLGTPGSEASVSFTLDTTEPIPSSVILYDDTGVSSTDSLTARSSPRFRAMADGSDTLVLFVDQVETDRRTGSGVLKPDRRLDDGEHRFVVLTMDPAGNVAESEPLDITIDTTRPDRVAHLEHLGSGWFQFDGVDDAAYYTYQVLGEASVEIGSRTAFHIPRLPFGTSFVSVRAIDAAGNRASQSLVRAEIQEPSRNWLDQRPGIDFVGPDRDFIRPDGILDLGIALSGLPTDRQIKTVDLQGHGGGRWQFGIEPASHWKVALFQAPGSSVAELYFQPYQFDQGRSYHLRLGFDDGTMVDFFLEGGPVDPTLSSVDVSLPGLSFSIDQALEEPQSLGFDSPSTSITESLRNLFPTETNLNARIEVVALSEPQEENRSNERDQKLESAARPWQLSSWRRLLNQSALKFRGWWPT